MEHPGHRSIWWRARYPVVAVTIAILVLAGTGAYLATRPPLGVSLFQAMDVALPQVRSWAEDAVLIAASGIESRSAFSTHFKGDQILVPSSPQIGSGLPPY